MNLLVEIFLVFFKIGLFSFGGGYAMMPLFEKEIINGLHWISYSDFIDIVAIAQTTPGPFAVNSATFIGNKLAGFWGSVVATLGCYMERRYAYVGHLLKTAKVYEDLC